MTERDLPVQGMPWEDLACNGLCPGIGNISQGSRF